MIEPAGSDSRFSYAKAVAAGHVGEIENRGHSLQVHREIGMGHLRLEDTFQALAAEKFRSKTVKVKFVLRGI